MDSIIVIMLSVDKTGNWTSLPKIKCIHSHPEVKLYLVYASINTTWGIIRFASTKFAPVNSQYALMY